MTVIDRDVHNGSVAVVSAPGRGSAFSFTLPAYDGEPPQAAQPVADNGVVAAVGG